MRTPFRSLLVIMATFWSAGVSAQNVLDRYIHDGLSNNIVLQQKNIALDRAVLSLRIADSYFAPTVGLQGNYTSGNGGRYLSFPVGDLLNPVYRTLNQLTASDKFPEIANVNQNFFPHNFYDAKVHTTVPLLNTDLVYNRKIAQQQVMLQEFETDIYRRELVRNIKTAYYNYLSALEAVRIYESALARAEEGRRVNESLLANGKAVPAYVLRSQSEVETVRAQKADAERQVGNAQLYFNFLLNREPDSTIDTSYDVNAALLDLRLSDLDAINVSGREELRLLRESVELNRNVERMNALYWMPRVNGFLDLGSQASDWVLNGQSKYYLFGVQLDIPVFGGMRNRNKTRVSSLDVRTAQLGFENSQRQIALSASTSRNNLLTAHQNYQSALRQQEAAQSYQRLLDKGYQEGVNTFIEALDARNQMTVAQLQVSINRYRVLSASAQVERETASYLLTSNNEN